MKIEKQIKELGIIKQLIEFLEATSSTKEKEFILVTFLGKNPEIYKYLEYVYNPHKQFYLTSITAKKKSQSLGLLDTAGIKPDLFYILDGLSSRNVSGQRACDIWLGFIKAIPKDIRFVAERILDKDLKCRTGVKILNKALDTVNLPQIKLFSVAKGYLWEDENIWEDESVWYASRKYDGVRGNLILGESSPMIFSRDGIAFDVFDNLLKEFSERYNGPPCIFDGELSLKTKDGSDDFQGLMKQLRRKNHQIPNACLHCFDWIPLNTKSQKEMPLRERLEIRDYFHRRMNCNLFIPVKQIKVKNENHLEKLKQGAFERNWEGIILRKDTPFKQGKSRDMYKIKKKQDAEYKVIDIECGEMNIVVNGKEKTVKTMKRAMIKVKGCIVGVGSGWRVSQRREFFNHPENIIGKIITVEYDKITKNQKGGYGLRFPVVKWIHGEERKT